jgi:hypothetical protein
MTAAIYNLVIDQGSDFSVEFTLSEDGSAKDLTNYSARAQMRKAKSAADVSATFTCTIATPTNGIIKMELPNGTSKVLEAGRYYYDLEIHTGNDALVSRLLQGEVDLTQEVTR